MFFVLIFILSFWLITWKLLPFYTEVLVDIWKNIYFPCVDRELTARQIRGYYVELNQSKNKVCGFRVQSDPDLFLSLRTSISLLCSDTDIEKCRYTAVPNRGDIKYQIILCILVNFVKIWTLSIGVWIRIRIFKIKNWILNIYTIFGHCILSQFCILVAII